MTRSRLFFPFYLTEHSELTNRRLHVVGTSVAITMMIFNPLIGMGLLGGGCIGYLLCEPLSGLPHGIFEFLSMIAYFLSFAHLNDVLSISFATLVCGYAFAWVGHFVYQKNRPATFIYPTYSLMGDFKMWSQEAPKLIQEVIGGAGSTASRTAPQTKSKN